MLVLEKSCKKQNSMWNYQIQQQADIPSVKQVQMSNGKFQNELGYMTVTSHNEYNLTTAAHSQCNNQSAANVLPRYCAE